MAEVGRVRFVEMGEVARRSLGIDGTPGDAQDVPHPFWPHEGPGCLVCGLAESYRMHGGKEE